MNTIRAKVDGELTRRIGTWFTVRQVQDRLRINPSTLKPLIMKYAREGVLRRRKVKGTARSVEFSPAAGSRTNFEKVLINHMPYRNLNAGYKAAAKKSSKASAEKSTGSKKPTTSKKRK